jgi:cytochrome c-type biogenesis protein CcmH/NrfF
MNALWLIPAVVIAVGMGVAWYLSREAAAAARDLRAGVGQFGELRVALRRLQEDGEALRQTVRDRSRK